MVAIGGVGTLLFLPASLGVPVGLVVAVLGLLLAAQFEGWWVCRKCRSKFQRALSLADLWVLWVGLGALAWLVYRSR